MEQETKGSIMPDLSEREHLEQLIPSLFWNDGRIFKQNLSLELITLMKANDNELDLALEPFNIKSLDKNAKKRIWISFAVSHPHLTSEQLHQIGKQLELSANDLFQISLSVRNVVVFNNLLADFERKGLLTSLIRDNNYHVFRWAAEEGAIDILAYLVAKLPTALPAMITALDFEAFKKATAKGRLDVVKFITEHAGRYLEDMLASDNFDAFLRALEHHHSPVVNYLLNYASLFAHAEQHEEEYNDYVVPFTNTKLTELRLAKNQYEIEHPKGVFDVSEAEATLLFYCLRNLIRRNDPSLHDQMLFLLEIQAVRNLLHREVTPEKPNELIRLALTKNNQVAAELLLAIPEVHDLAEQNNYYQDELSGRLNLRALARDRESSMTALSQGEQHRLEEVLKRYGGQLKHVTVAQVMSDLRQQLKTQYDANPAFITTLDTSGKAVKTNLPMDWKAFQELPLNAEERAKALKAYYQHTEHSTWRYLLKPNPWMHDEAHYVYANPDNETERWATFEEYQPLIALLYLAAKDTSTPATDGYTVATRVEQFIKELALIGRAHNWDDIRVKLDAHGSILLDDNDNPIFEEYDNLEGDRPSCWSGIKRRLFQAVLGHPLLVVLTSDKINAELYEFVRQHFSIVINDSNRAAIRTIWNKAVDGTTLDDTDWNTLKEIDLSIEKQNEFIELLTKKYGKQFTDDPFFNQKLIHAFVFKKAADAHLLNFGYTHPEQFFDTLNAKRPKIGLFDNSAPTDSMDEEEPSDTMAPG